MLHIGRVAKIRRRLLRCAPRPGKLCGPVHEVALLIRIFFLNLGNYLKELNSIHIDLRCCSRTVVVIKATAKTRIIFYDHATGRFTKSPFLSNFFFTFRVPRPLVLKENLAGQDCEVVNMSERLSEMEILECVAGDSVSQQVRIHFSAVCSLLVKLMTCFREGTIRLSIRNRIQY